MVVLDSNKLKLIAEQINSAQLREKRQKDYYRFLIYNGQIKEIVKIAISKEFKKPETVEELINRLVPINIMQKIVNKLAGVYTEAPLREVVDANESDAELLAEYEEEMQINSRFKEANRYLKLFKRDLMEPFVDDNGWPCLRNLPSHTYEVFSFNSRKPNTPDVIAIIIKDDNDSTKQIINVWTDSQHFVINGRGEVIKDKMDAMGNPDGINPYGVIPFIYINESTYSVNPIQDEDLLSFSIVIPLLLTDLLFALKYQAWSIIYTIGLTGEIPFNPNSIIQLEYGPGGEKPEIDTVKPDLSVDDMLKTVNALISMLLSTKNLSLKTIASGMGTTDVVSGVSKMLDSAESVEDKKDQQAYFLNAESELWWKLSAYIIPYWRKNGLLDPEMNKEFSSEFEVSIIYRDPKPLLTDKERIDNIVLKLKNKLTSYRLAFYELYPEYSDEQINELMMEIAEDQLKFGALQVGLINEANKAPVKDIEDDNGGV